MKTFEYIAVTSTGERCQAHARAESEVDLDRDLEARGLALASARVVTSETKNRMHRLDRSSLLSFTTQLATVTGAGVPIVEGMRSIGSRLETQEARDLVSEMVAGLQAGESLSDVMARHPQAFPPVYRASVVAGEAAGSLDTVLERLAKYLEWSQGMRATAMQALIYPCILMTAIFGLVLVLLYFVLPRILGMFPGGRDSLPIQTRIVLGASDFLRENVVVLTLGVVFAVVAWTRWTRTPAGRARFHGALLKIPRLGKVQRQLATSRFASTASILQGAGCDVFTVMGVAGSSCGNKAMEDAFARAADSVRRGSTITEGLDREPEIDPLLRQMVGVGEKSGELDGCLDRLVRYYDDEIPRSVKRFLTVLEPALLVFAACVVAFILLAALMPIFELYEKM
ncbi:MAG: type II secretion system F family protein [Planctomycetota bacterium]|nr:type II secretion system F family protein [Planctomycetota bacterium]